MGARTFNESILSHFSSGVSQNFPKVAIPALFITISGTPYVLNIVYKSVLQPSFVSRSASIHPKTEVL